MYIIYIYETQHLWTPAVPANFVTHPLDFASRTRTPVPRERNDRPMAPGTRDVSKPLNLRVKKSERTQLAEHMLFTHAEHHNYRTFFRGVLSGGALSGVV